MRDVLNQSSDDEDEGDELEPDFDSLNLAQGGRSGYVICAPDILPDVGSLLKHPSRLEVQRLYSLFMMNVDPVVKILHTPSLRRYLIEEIGKLDCSPGPRGWDALRFAIYYATVTSLTPDECFNQLDEERVVLLSRYRSSTELALARADFVNTEDMSTLQALVFYLVRAFPLDLFSARFPSSLVSTRW